MIARESAEKQGRPCWSDLLQTVWRQAIDKPALVVITDDFHKRLWPYARPTTIGGQTAIYVHDKEWVGLNGTVVVDYSAMLDCLAFIERLLGAAFSKVAIRDGLLHSTKVALSIAEAVRAERALSAWRTRPEFGPALMVAQKRRVVP
jgi:hypothetical protein